jgi:hypothetical protein
LNKRIYFAISLLLLGFTLAIYLSIADSAFARIKNIGFEVFDCPVEGNSNFEKSGPCPDTDAKSTTEESPAVAEKSEPNAGDTTETRNILPQGIPQLTDPFRSLIK